MQLIPWGFLYASQLPDCLLEKLVTWKHHWVQTKKGPTKAGFLQPKEHERDSLVRQEILENNYSTAAKQHRKKQNKTKLCSLLHPNQQRLNRDSYSHQTLTRHPTLPARNGVRRGRVGGNLDFHHHLSVTIGFMPLPLPAGWCQKRPRGEQALLLLPIDKGTHMPWCWQRLAGSSSNSLLPLPARNGSAEAQWRARTSIPIRR